jgi:KDO transferase-3
VSNWGKIIFSQTPRPLDITNTQRALLRICPSLKPTSRLSVKLLRLIYGKKLKHMNKVGAAFELRPTDQIQVWGIFWKGRKLGETVPFPEPEPEDNIWLITSGPSVKELNLSKLAKESVMAVNGSIAVCKEHKISPRFYASTDRDFFEHRMHLIKVAITSGAHCFFSYNGISRICEQAPEILKDSKISLLETANRYYGVSQITTAEFEDCCSRVDNGLVVSHTGNSKVGWSDDIAEGVFASNTVAYSACQIANYLKAPNVFIAGMDLGASKGEPIRAYESGDQARPSTLADNYETSILPAFELMQTVPLHSRFWNLSANSRLPGSVIPKMSYERALRGGLL